MKKNLFTWLSTFCLAITLLLSGNVWGATYTAKLQIGDEGTVYYAYNDNGTVKAKTEATTWYLEECGTNNSVQLYYIRTSDNQYMYIDKNSSMCGNGDWPTYRVKTGTLNSNSNDYKWFVAKGNWGSDIRHIVSFTGGTAASTINESNNNPKWLVLHRHHWQSSWRWLWNNTDPGSDVACGGNIKEGGNAYNGYKSYFIDKTQVGGGGGGETNCSFKKGTTIYLNLNGNNWPTDGGKPAAMFYYVDNANKNYGNKSTSWGGDMTGSNQIGSGNYALCTQVSGDYWKVTVPDDNLAHVRFVRVQASNAEWTWNCQKNKLALSDMGSNNCVKLEGWDANATWDSYNSGSAVEKSCPIDPSTPTVTNTYRLRGDLWLSSGDWKGGSSSNIPLFVNSQDNTTASVSYVMPTAQARLTLTKDGTDQSSDQWNGDKSVTNKLNKTSFSSSKYYFAAQSSVKKYTFVYEASTDKIYGYYSDYDIDKSNWDVYIDDAKKGTTDANGELTISGLTSSSDGTAHTIYLRKKDASTEIHGINWFGGLYIDKNASNVAWGTQYVYYDATKFSSTEWPIVGNKDAKGCFKLNESKDVKVTFDGGKITINKVTAPTPLTDEFYVFGAGGTNWVTGWSQNKGKAEYKMTNSGTIASKTFYNVKGNGCQFKVWNKTQNTELNWANYDGTKSQNITCSNCSSDNICFDLSANSDITVYTDGTNVWAKASAHQKLDDANYYLAGDYNGWHTWTDPYKLTKVDDYTHTITKRWNSSDFTTCAGLSRCKILKGDSDWGNAFVISNIHAESSSFKTKSDCESGDTRIVVDLDGKVQDVTFTIWKDANGNKKVRIVAVDVPDRNVKFYSGSTLVDTKVIKDGSTVTPPTNIEAPSAGKVLEGWYENSELSGSKYNFDTPISGGDKNFYAKWIDGVSVTFETYCSQTVPQQAIAIGGNATNPGNLNTIQTQSGNHEVATFKGWYADAACTTQFDFKSTISVNTTIYAKWEMRSETFNVVGDLWMYDGTSWNNAKNPSFTRSDDKRSISVSYIAPKGLNRFEVIRGNDWNYKVPMDVDPNSPITVNVADGHMNFNLTKIQKVTITYNGRFSVSAEDYTPAFMDNMYITGDAWGTIGGTAMASWGGQDHSNQKLTNENGKGVVIVRDVAAGSNHQFKIYGTKGDYSVTGVDLFNAPYVDMVNKPSKLTWQNTGSNSIFGYPIPMSDNLWRNITFQVSEKIDMKITFDGAVVSMAELPKYTVSFNKNGATSADIPSQTMYEGRSATQPAAPFKPLYKFVKWQLNGVDYNFSTPVTADITLDAVYDLAQYYVVGPLWVKSDNLNYSETDAPAMTVTAEGATLELTIPKGNHTFGLLSARNFDTQYQITAAWDESKNYGITNCSVNGMYIHFTIDKIARVVITYDAAGKMSVRVKDDYVKKNGWYLMNYVKSDDKVAFDANGEYIVRNFAPCDKDFKITDENGDADAINGITRFGSPFVDMDASGDAKSCLWATTQTGDWGQSIPERSGDKFWKNAHVHICNEICINGTVDLKFTFDGVKITVAPVEHHTVSFNTGVGATTVDPVEAFDGNVATCPSTIPTRTDGAAFVEWRLNNEAFDWSAPITEDITLTAFWDVLQDRYDDVSDGGTLTLEHDYANANLTVDKPITIDAKGHQIGNLTVALEGDLTLSSAIQVNDFTICTKAGNTSTPASSGQVHNANQITLNGNAYFLYTLDPSGQVQYGWYDFTVPFPVDVMTGIKGIQNEELKADFTNERDYAVMEFLSDVRAQGQYGYKKFRGIMQPNRLYSITLDNDYNYNTIRFQKTTTGDLVAGDEITLSAYSATENKDANWNAVGNGTLHHANATFSGDYLQVYQTGNKTFMPVDPSDYSFVTGTAFMIQSTGTLTLNTATHDALLAPQRPNKASAWTVQIAKPNQVFTDQLFVAASEQATGLYAPGADLAKAGNIANVPVAQLWANAYDSKLCVHQAPLAGSQAAISMSVYAPSNGDYTISTPALVDNEQLFLTRDGQVFWNLSVAPCTLSLNQGTNDNLGLLVIRSQGVVTSVDNTSVNANDTHKVIINGQLYIIREHLIYDALGRPVSAPALVETLHE